MRFLFWHSISPTGRVDERPIAEAVVCGARAAGEDAECAAFNPHVEEPELRDCDVVGFIGVARRDAVAAYRAAGAGLLYFDKGYHSPAGSEPFWRVAANAHQPVDHVARAGHPPDRARAIGLLPYRPWKRPGPGAVLIDGGSTRQRAFVGLPEDAVLRVIDRLRGCGRPLIYRPKPSWREARPIPGTRFSNDRKRLAFDLLRSHVVITHSSNISVDAVRSGTPCIVLGNAVARPICSTSLDDLEFPRRAGDAERTRFFANLAWCQWRLRDYATAATWRHLRRMLEEAGS